MEEKTDFDFYVKFTKPLIFNLTQTNDRILAAAWVKKLIADKEAPEKIKLDYIKLLLFVLQRGRLVPPFNEHPNSVGELTEFPNNQTLVDVAKQIIEKGNEEKREKMEKRRKGESGDFPPFVSDFSADLLEYVAVQDIENFGVHGYYAISKEPLNTWQRVDKNYLPKAAKSMIEVSGGPATIPGTSSSPALSEASKTAEKSSIKRGEGDSTQPPKDIETKPEEKEESKKEEPKEEEPKEEEPKEEEPKEEEPKEEEPKEEEPKEEEPTEEEPKEEEPKEEAPKEEEPKEEAPKEEESKREEEKPKEPSIRKTPKRSGLGASPPSHPIGRISPPLEDREPPTWGTNLLEVKHEPEDNKMAEILWSGYEDTITGETPPDLFEDDVSFTDEEPLTREQMNRLLAAAASGPDVTLSDLVRRPLPLLPASHADAVPLEHSIHVSPETRGILQRYAALSPAGEAPAPRARIPFKQMEIEDEDLGGGAEYEVDEEYKEVEETLKKYADLFETLKSTKTPPKNAEVAQVYDKLASAVAKASTSKRPVKGKPPPVKAKSRVKIPPAKKQPIVKAQPPPKTQPRVKGQPPKTKSKSKIKPTKSEQQAEKDELKEFLASEKLTEKQVKAREKDAQPKKVRIPKIPTHLQKDVGAIAQAQYEQLLEPGETATPPKFEGIVVPKKKRTIPKPKFIPPRLRDELKDFVAQERMIEKQMQVRGQDPHAGGQAVEVPAHLQRDVEAVAAAQYAELLAATGGGPPPPEAPKKRVVKTRRIARRIPRKGQVTTIESQVEIQAEVAPSEDQIAEVPSELIDVKAQAMYQESIPDSGEMTAVESQVEIQAEVAPSEDQIGEVPAKPIDLDKMAEILWDFYEDTLPESDKNVLTGETPPDMFEEDVSFTDDEPLTGEQRNRLIAAAAAGAGVTLSDMVKRPLPLLPASHADAVPLEQSIHVSPESRGILQRYAALSPAGEAPAPRARIPLKQMEIEDEDLGGEAEYEVNEEYKEVEDTLKKYADLFETLKSTKTPLKSTEVAQIYDKIADAVAKASISKRPVKGRPPVKAKSRVKTQAPAKKQQPVVKAQPPPKAQPRVKGQPPKTKSKSKIKPTKSELQAEKEELGKTAAPPKLEGIVAKKKKTIPKPKFIPPGLRDELKDFVAQERMIEKQMQVRGQDPHAGGQTVQVPAHLQRDVEALAAAQYAELLAATGGGPPPPEAPKKRSVKARRIARRIPRKGQVTTIESQVEIQAEVAPSEDQIAEVPSELIDVKAQAKYQESIPDSGETTAVESQIEVHVETQPKKLKKIPVKKFIPPTGYKDELKEFLANERLIEKQVKAHSTEPEGKTKIPKIPTHLQRDVEAIAEAQYRELAGLPPKAEKVQKIAVRTSVKGRRSIPKPSTATSKGAIQPAPEELQPETKKKKPRVDKTKQIEKKARDELRDFVDNEKLIEKQLRAQGKDAQKKGRYPQLPAHSVKDVTAIAEAQLQELLSESPISQKQKLPDQLEREIEAIAEAQFDALVDILTEQEEPEESDDEFLALERSVLGETEDQVEPSDRVGALALLGPELPSVIAKAQAQYEELMQDGGSVVKESKIEIQKVTPKRTGMPRGRFDRRPSPPTPETDQQAEVLTVSALVHSGVPPSPKPRTPRQRRPPPSQKEMDQIMVVGGRVEPSHRAEVLPRAQLPGVIAKAQYKESVQGDGLVVKESQIQMQQVTPKPKGMPRGRFDRRPSPPTPETDQQSEVLTVSALVHTGVPPPSPKPRTPRRRRPPPSQAEMDQITVLGVAPSTSRAKPKPPPKDYDMELIPYMPEFMDEFGDMEKLIAQQAALLAQFAKSKPAEPVERKQLEIEAPPAVKKEAAKKTPSKGQVKTAKTPVSGKRKDLVKTPSTPAVEKQKEPVKTPSTASVRKRKVKTPKTPAVEKRKTPVKTPSTPAVEELKDEVKTPSTPAPRKRKVLVKSVLVKTPSTPAVEKVEDEVKTPSTPAPRKRKVLVKSVLVKTPSTPAVEEEKDKIKTPSTPAARKRKVLVKSVLVKTPSTPAVEEEKDEIKTPSTPAAGKRKVLVKRPSAPKRKGAVKTPSAERVKDEIETPSAEKVSEDEFKTPKTGKRKGRGLRKQKVDTPKSSIQILEAEIEVREEEPVTPAKDTQALSKSRDKASKPPALPHIDERPEEWYEDSQGQYGEELDEDDWKHGEEFFERPDLPATKTQTKDELIKKILEKFGRLDPNVIPMLRPFMTEEVEEALHDQLDRLEIAEPNWINAIQFLKEYIPKHSPPPERRPRPPQYLFPAIEFPEGQETIQDIELPDELAEISPTRSPNRSLELLQKIAQLFDRLTDVSPEITAEEDLITSPYFTPKSQKLVFSPSEDPFGLPKLTLAPLVPARPSSKRPTYTSTPKPPRIASPYDEKDFVTPPTKEYVKTSPILETPPRQEHGQLKKTPGVDLSQLSPINLNWRQSVIDTIHSICGPDVFDIPADSMMEETPPELASPVSPPVSPLDVAQLKAEILQKAGRSKGRKKKKIKTPSVPPVQELTEYATPPRIRLDFNVSDDITIEESPERYPSPSDVVDEALFSVLPSPDVLDQIDVFDYPVFDDITTESPPEDIYQHRLSPEAIRTLNFNTNQRITFEHIKGTRIPIRGKRTPGLKPVRESPVKGYAKGAQIEYLTTPPTTQRKAPPKQAPPEERRKHLTRTRLTFSPDSPDRLQVAVPEQKSPKAPSPKTPEQPYIVVVPPSDEVITTPQYPKTEERRLVQPEKSRRVPISPPSSQPGTPVSRHPVSPTAGRPTRRKEIRKTLKRSRLDFSQASDEHQLEIQEEEETHRVTSPRPVAKPSPRTPKQPPLIVVVPPSDEIPTTPQYQPGEEDEYAKPRKTTPVQYSVTPASRRPAPSSGSPQAGPRRREIRKRLKTTRLDLSQRPSFVEAEQMEIREEEEPPVTRPELDKEPSPRTPPRQIPQIVVVPPSDDYKTPPRSPRIAEEEMVYAEDLPDFSPPQVDTPPSSYRPLLAPRKGPRSKEVRKRLQKIRLDFETEPDYANLEVREETRRETRSDLDLETPPDKKDYNRSFMFSSPESDESITPESPQIEDEELAQAEALPEELAQAEALPEFSPPSPLSRSEVLQRFATDIKEHQKTQWRAKRRPKYREMFKNKPESLQEVEEAPKEERISEIHDEILAEIESELASLEESVSVLDESLPSGLAKPLTPEKIDIYLKYETPPHLKRPARTAIVPGAPKTTKVFPPKYEKEKYFAAKPLDIASPAAISMSSYRALVLEDLPEDFAPREFEDSRVLLAQEKSPELREFEQMEDVYEAGPSRRSPSRSPTKEELTEAARLAVLMQPPPADAVDEDMLEFEQLEALVETEDGEESSRMTITASSESRQIEESETEDEDLDEFERLEAEMMEESFRASAVSPKAREAAAAQYALIMERPIEKQPAIEPESSEEAESVKEEEASESEGQTETESVEEEVAPQLTPAQQRAADQYNLIMDRLKDTLEKQDQKTPKTLKTRAREGAVALIKSSKGDTSPEFWDLLKMYQQLGRVNTSIRERTPKAGTRTLPRKYREVRPSFQAIEETAEEYKPPSPMKFNMRWDLSPGKRAELRAPEIQVEAEESAASTIDFELSYIESPPPIHYHKLLPLPMPTERGYQPGNLGITAVSPPELAPAEVEAYDPGAVEETEDEQIGDEEIDEDDLLDKTEPEMIPASPEEVGDDELIEQPQEQTPQAYYSPTPRSATSPARSPIRKYRMLSEPPLVKRKLLSLEFSEEEIPEVTPYSQQLPPQRDYTARMKLIFSPETPVQTLVAAEPAAAAAEVQPAAEIHPEAETPQLATSTPIAKPKGAKPKRPTSGKRKPASAKPQTEAIPEEQPSELIAELIPETPAKSPKPEQRQEQRVSTPRPIQSEVISEEVEDPYSPIIVSDEIPPHLRNFKWMDL